MLEACNMSGPANFHSHTQRPRRGHTDNVLVSACKFLRRFMHTHPISTRHTTSGMATARPIHRGV